MTPTATSEVLTYTCSGCLVTASWMAEHQQEGLPAHWAHVGDELLCLGCRRNHAGEAAVELVDEEASSEDKVKARKMGRIDFEISRDATRPNGVIARACGTSPAVIARARTRLGLADEVRI